VVELYSHGNGRVGVMVEAEQRDRFCRSLEPFRTLAHELALQIAASSPVYIREEISRRMCSNMKKQVAAAKAREEGSLKR